MRCGFRMALTLPCLIASLDGRLSGKVDYIIIHLFILSIFLDSEKSRKPCNWDFHIVWHFFQNRLKE